MPQLEHSPEQKSILGRDSPVGRIEDDLLNALGVARAIHRVLTGSPPSWSTRIGLFGPWGSGKTSILNLLQGLQEAEGALVISFSAWSSSNETAVIGQFYEALLNKLQSEKFKAPLLQRSKRHIKRWTGKGKGWIGLAGAGAEQLLPIPPTVTKVATEALSKLASAATGWAKIGGKDLEAVLAMLGGRRVVVFIDDLDRADPKVVPKTLLALRELLDWPGFSFVLAFDRRAIASALHEYSKAFGDDSQGFLEKVIDVPFEVPKVSQDDLRRLAMATFRECCSLLPAEVINDVLSVLPLQPRRVKLIARTLGALQPTLKRHASQEIDWIGLVLYEIVREASPAAAEWVARAANSTTGEWDSLFGNVREEDEQNEKALKAISDIIANAGRPAEAERASAAGLRLLRHWGMTGESNVMYWVRLFFREPSMTSSELRALRKEIALKRDCSILVGAISDASRVAGLAVDEAASECLEAALSEYRTCLHAMSDASHDIEWKHSLGEAEETLSVLECFWLHAEDPTIKRAANAGSHCASLFDIAQTWIAWTANPGEAELRARELELLLRATSQCSEPDVLFLATDPFWNSDHSSSEEQRNAKSELRDAIRDALAPRVLNRLFERLQKAGGMEPVARGDDELAPWLVESEDSPLYMKPELTRQFLEVLGKAVRAEEATALAIAENAHLYLQQLLFRTRNASWGGREDAARIHLKFPELIPTAWDAATAVGVPFRMRSSFAKLRKDLIAVGVDAARLREPNWLSGLDAAVRP